MRRTPHPYTPTQVIGKEPDHPPQRRAEVPLATVGYMAPEQIVERFPNTAASVVAEARMARLGSR